MREEIVGKVDCFRNSWHFDFDFLVFKVLSIIRTLTWPVNKYVSRQGRGIHRRNESTVC